MTAVHVPGYGPRDAKIVIVGEAPGVEEERQGQPFVGSSGKLLTQMLSAAGIDRQTVYFTNVSKLRPPNNDFGVFYNDKQRRAPSDYLQRCYAELADELRAIHPNVICPAGGEALKAIFGRGGIDKWRGSILSTKLGKIVPTLHPAYVLRQYTARPVVELDLRRVAAEASTADVQIPKPTFNIRPSFAQVCSYLSRRFSRLSFDIETTGPMVRCLGLSGDPQHAICIPFISRPNYTQVGGSRIILEPEHGGTVTSHWSAAEEYEIVRLLDRLFSDPAVEKVAQNFPFDSVILAREFGFTFRNLHQDTMLAHHTCYCELPKGLDFLTSIYTRYPYYSDYDVNDDQQTWLYNCWDALVTREISFVLDKELVDCGVRDYYYNFKHQPMLAFTRAETRGILVDKQLKDSRTVQTRTEVQQLEVKIQAVVGIPNFNPNSSQQLQNYFYNTLRIPPYIHRKTKQPTVDKEARRKIKAKYDQLGPFIDLLDEHSAKSTLLSNFLEKPLGSDNRARTHYNPAGTDTDRLSSSEPIFDPGMNLQNIPRGDFRLMFISDSGWSLIKSDLSSAEFRAVVWYAKIRWLIERYAKEPLWDVHTWFAAIAFGKPESAVERKRNDGKLSERDIAKNGIYGGNYKMFYKTAAATYKMPEETAKFILDKYRATIPEIPAWWSQVEQVVNTTRVLENPLGRRRKLFDRLDDELYRTCYSDLAQSLVAGLINRAFCLADEIFDERECYPLLQVHDEIVFQCKDELVPKYTPLIRNLMEYPVQFPDVPEPLVIPCEIKVGKNWAMKG